MKTQKQLKLLSSENSAYGGELLNTRKGRSRGRPLAVKQSMHLVLRSSRATGEWSFRRTANRKKVEGSINKFSAKFKVKVLSLANVGNHLHFHIQLTNRFTYKPFIRAITAAIASPPIVIGQPRFGPDRQAFRFLAGGVHLFCGRGIDMFWVFVSGFGGSGGQSPTGTCGGKWRNL